MTDNQASIFVRWDDKDDILQLRNSTPLLVSHLRHEFKAKHLAASISTDDIHVFTRRDGKEMDALDELGYLGKSRNDPLYISVVAALDAVAVGPPLASPPPSPRNRGISEQAAVVFEVDVNRYLEDNLQSILPRCEFGFFNNREIYDGEFALEIDSFAYMFKDTLDRPTEKLGNGIYVVRPPGITMKTPVMAPTEHINRSPRAVAASWEEKADKYIVGESYYGDEKDKMETKVGELEAKLTKLRNRFIRLQNIRLDDKEESLDVTSLFGAAILAFTCNDPHKQKEVYTSAILRRLSKSRTPILWRLAEAERLFVVVLSIKDAANTCALRNIVSDLQNVALSIKALQKREEEIKQLLQTVQEENEKNHLENKQILQTIHEENKQLLQMIQEIMNDR